MTPDRLLGSATLLVSQNMFLCKSSQPYTPNETKKWTPNARINRAGRIASSLQVLRMRDKLFPLRLNELLGVVVSANSLLLDYCHLCRHTLPAIIPLDIHSCIALL